VKTGGNKTRNVSYRRCSGVNQQINKLLSLRGFDREDIYERYAIIILGDVYRKACP